MNVIFTSRVILYYIFLLVFNSDFVSNLIWLNTLRLSLSTCSVNRIAATGTTFECDLLLDINSEIYSLKDGEKITVVLASSLNLDGSPDDHFSYQPNTGEDHTLADTYEYVMHGRVFDITYKKDGAVIVAASFGGLLMKLTGAQRHLSSIQPDMRLYLLVKKDWRSRNFPERKFHMLTLILLLIRQIKNHLCAQSSLSYLSTRKLCPKLMKCKYLRRTIE